MAATCFGAGMSAVCWGPPGHAYDSPLCLVTPLSRNNALVMLRNQVCSPGETTCQIMENLFTFMHAWKGHGECGWVNGTITCGENVTTTCSSQHFAYCAKRTEINRLNEQ